MGKNEIRLRGQLHERNIHQHRNYEVLMKKHKRSVLFRRSMRFFIYSLIVTGVVLVLIMLSIYIVQMKKRQEKEKNANELRTSLLGSH